MIYEEKIDRMMEMLLGVSKAVWDLKEDVSVLKGDVQELKGEVQDLKKRMDCMEIHMENIENTVQQIDKCVTKIEIYQENVLRKQMDLLAENFSNLTDKLNEAIKVEDGNKLRDYKLIALEHRMDVMEENLCQLKEA